MNLFREIIFIFLSLFGWVMVVFLTLFYFLGSLLICIPVVFILRVKLQTLFHGAAVMWAKSTIACFPMWQIRVEGKENIKPNQQYVVVANHQSLLDILLALAGIPVPFRFMAKKELFSIPFLGWHMGFAGYIPVNRADINGRKAALQHAHEDLKNRESILLFPEGTRSLDGEIHTFKPGSFNLALREGVPLLPVVLDGTGDAIPKNSWKIQKKTEFVVSIGQPIMLHSQKDLREQIEVIHQQLAEKLKQIRKERRD